jgi:hypothetical protein
LAFAGSGALKLIPSNIAICNIAAINTANNNESSLLNEDVVGVLLGCI